VGGVLVFSGNLVSQSPKARQNSCDLPTPDIPIIFISKDIENFRVQTAPTLLGAGLKPFVGSRGDIPYRHVGHIFSISTMIS
jgi:hypothetical protein